MDPLPALPRARPKRRIADLRSKTTRVTIAPIEPSAASAFVSSPVPLRVVFTLTPLLGLLPLEVQTTVKENVAGRLQKSLSTSFFQKLNIQREEWMDMVHISAGKSSEDDGWSEGTISP